MDDGPCGVREEGLSRERCKQMLMLTGKVQSRSRERRGCWESAWAGRRGETQQSSRAWPLLEGMPASACGSLKKTLVSTTARNEPMSHWGQGRWASLAVHCALHVCGGCASSPH